jgi:hypothetical protein
VYAMGFMFSVVIVSVIMMNVVAPDTPNPAVTCYV